MLDIGLDPFCNAASAAGAADGRGLAMLLSHTLLCCFSLRLVCSGLSFVAEAITPGQSAKAKPRAQKSLNLGSKPVAPSTEGLALALHRVVQDPRVRVWGLGLRFSIAINACLIILHYS